MARFRVRALSGSDEITEDIVEAPDRATVVQRLGDEGCLPVRVREIAPESGNAPTRPTGAKGRRWVATRRRLRRGSMAIFIRELQTFLDAGLTADRALAVIASTSSVPAMAEIANDMRDGIRRGVPLSDTMAAHGETFDPFHVAIVRAGEAGGTLGQSLDVMAAYVERSDSLRASVRSALIYPAILVCATFVSLLVFLAYVVPQFEALFGASAAEPPAITRGVFAVSIIVREYGMIALGAATVLLLLLRSYGRAAAPTTTLQRLVLGIPVVGDIVRRTEVERIVRSLSALLGSDVPLATALPLAAETARNGIIAGTLGRVADDVKDGDRLADSIERTGEFPALAVELVRVGEESGQLQAMLVKLADVFSRQVETSLNRLVSLIAPALVVVAGIFVGIVVIALHSSILSVNALAP